MRLVCVFAVLLTVASAAAQNGETVYKEHCASCHNSATPRVPPEAALRSMNLMRVLGALQTGVMKTVGDTLTPEERYAVALYLSAGATSKAAAPPASAFCAKSAQPFRFSSSAPAWTGWSTGVDNARFQNLAGAGLAAADVPRLKLKWAFSLGEEISARSQPAVAGGRIFFGTVPGSVYSLDAHSGCIVWTSAVEGPIRSALVIGPGKDKKHAGVFFGAGHDAYALDAETGAQLWKVRIGEHFAALITAAPLLHQGVLYFGVSSFEETLPPIPTYECCTFRGSVVALKADTGRLLWRTYTIASAPQPTEKNKAGRQMYGPSGAGVWSTPTFDEKHGVIYVATGDNYSHPAAQTSDAVLALDAKSGKLLWSRQVTADDVYNNACAMPGNANCPPPSGGDFDFGQPPILVALANGRRELVIGQKSGVAYALDPDKQGAILWQTRLGSGGPLGGIMWGSATDGKKMYVADSDLKFKGIAPDKTSAQGFRLLLNPDLGGGLFALDLQTGEKIWSAPPPHDCGDRDNCSPGQSQAVTAIQDVVFSGSLDGHIRAYSTSDGKILWDTDTARDYTTVNGLPARGGSLDGPGPVVADGMLYVSSGYGQYGGMPGNVLLAFSVEGQ
jgi:polyvinyl alcohol dehydrogenase (cytochrome)